VQNFQILIISAVKICKQCLLTASASGEFPHTPWRGFAHGPHWVTCSPQTLWAIAAQVKIPGTASDVGFMLGLACDVLVLCL